MSWFPNYQTKDTALSRAALLAAGKALAICNDFEGSCRHILHVADAVAYLEDNEGSSLEEAFEAFKEQFLHGTIKSLGRYSDIREDDIATLEKTKDARNYIAHDGATFFTARMARHCVAKTIACTSRNSG